jgi:hypothetical protein
VHLKEIRSFVGHEQYVTSAALTPDGRMLATGSADKTLPLWEVATGLERRRITGHKERVHSLALSPNGRLLAAASSDAPIFTWDVYALDRPRATIEKLSQKVREDLWRRLADTDGAAAFQAICELIAHPAEAVALAESGWKQALRAPVQQIEKWIGDLDSVQFAVRKNATSELERFVTGHEKLLRKALDQATTLEVRQRLENILGRPNPERLRRGRMLEVLEQVATAPARQLMRTFADQTEDAQLAADAKTSLRRLLEP